MAAIVVVVPAALVGVIIYQSEDWAAMRRWPISDLQAMAEEERLGDGYRPFTDPTITELCIVGGGVDIAPHVRGLEEWTSTYDLLAIVERRADADRVSLISSGNFNVHTLQNDICTSQPGSIFVQKSREHYNVVDNEKVWNVYELREAP
ncbi:MAG TPA: hypothetical protein VGN97_20985 [Mesorhizobium sp.]|jgi:hypothetical protein|nr:hypothetical protein [Mesorhizobium sp.]